MRVLDLHRWDVSTSEARELQRDLASKVVRSRCLHSAPRLIAGTDMSVDRINGRARAAAVVLEFPSLFREAPLVLEALSMLHTEPELVLVDGQGIAHPRRFGLASHIGVFVDTPTIGCAKSLLCGEYSPVGDQQGEMSEVVHHGAVVGVALRTRTSVKPVFVSIGHKVDLAAAIEWVLHCCRGYRLPEPTRLAHQASNGMLATS